MICTGVQFHRQVGQILWDDPQGYILAKGGVIKMALQSNEAIGCCALLKVSAALRLSNFVTGQDILWLQMYSPGLFCFI